VSTASSPKNTPDHTQILFAKNGLNLAKHCRDLRPRSSAIGLGLVCVTLQTHRVPIIVSELDRDAASSIERLDELPIPNSVLVVKLES